MTRQRLYEIIEVNTSNDSASKLYDIFMIFTIIISIIPLAFKKQLSWLGIVDNICITVFIFDYLLRWFTADFKFKTSKAFIKYPFSAMALIDLLSILPSITALNSSLKLLKIFRLIRSFRLFRVLKFFRYSKSITMIINVFKKQKDALVVIGSIAIFYILISALVILNVEPDTFNSYFDAVYWATVSLTTVGYGDIYPITPIGQIITMLSSLFGIAIVALPASIITAGMMDEIEKTSN